MGHDGGTGTGTGWGRDPNWRCFGGDYRWFAIIVVHLAGIIWNSYIASNNAAINT